MDNQAWLFVAQAAWISLFWCVAMISVLIAFYSIKR